MKRFLLTLFLIHLLIDLSAQDLSRIADDEKVFLLLPDSCFERFKLCHNDKADLFSIQKRQLLLEKVDSVFQGSIFIRKAVREESGEFTPFQMQAITCVYNTVLQCFTGNLDDNFKLVAVTVQENDMCVSRQTLFCYEYSIQKGTLKMMRLPNVYISDFVDKKVLAKNKIDPSLAPPHVTSFSQNFDTLEVRFERENNCDDPDPYDPLSTLKESDFTNKPIVFCRRKNIFVRHK